MYAQRGGIAVWCLAFALAGGWLDQGSASWARALAEAPESGGHTAGTGHAAGTGGGAGSPNPLAVDPDLAVWTLIVFVVLLGVLWKFAWGPISEALEKRERAISEQIAAARQMHEDAKLALAAHEKKLAGAADQVRAILDEARRDAEHTKGEIVAEAKSAAEAERVRALRDIDAATDAAIKSLAERSSDMAVDLAGKIVSAKLSKSDHARLIQEAQAQFSKSGPSKN